MAVELARYEEGVTFARIARRRAARSILLAVLFTKRLRDGIQSGRITCSIRIWLRPRVKVGNRYRMDAGEIEVDSILPITFDDITPELARASGFKGVVDLLRVAKHGRGENVYLVRFHYVPGAGGRPPRRVTTRRRAR
jgi:hypothetical protein